MRLFISIAAVNNYLRFTGFRLSWILESKMIDQGNTFDEVMGDPDTRVRIGIEWWGSPFVYRKRDDH